jgi:hypothetical protein
LPTWNELVSEFESIEAPARSDWLIQRFTGQLAEVSKLRGGKNVIFYASAFLQQQNVPSSHISITHEDVNGFMGVLKGMEWGKGLCLIVHSPGGVTNATESIVDYLRAKFPSIEAIVPTFAMSAGTMISLASDRIFMGKHSQLGPIDPQMPMPNGRSYSAGAIVEQFEEARRDVLENPAVAPVWAPLIASSGPALVQEAKNNLEYSKQIVANWLSRYMFAGRADAEALGETVASYFNAASQHKSHGRRIGAAEAKAQGVVIESLEDDQPLQEAVLTSYHLMTLLFQQSIATKLIWSDAGLSWMKNWVGVQGKS